MSNIENRTLKIRKLPESTQSFERMFDEIANDDVRIDITSMSTKLFDLSSDDCEEAEEANLVLNSTLKDNDEQNYRNHNYGYDRCSINPENEISQRNLSTQDSLCTECKFGNNLSRFFDSFNFTQRQTDIEFDDKIRSPQSSFFPYATHDIRDQSDGKMSSRKRSLSTSPEKGNSKTRIKSSSQSQNCLKKFKSEGCVSTAKNVGIHISERIESTIEQELSIHSSDINLERRKTFVEAYPTEFINCNDVSDNDVSEHISELEKNYLQLSDCDEDPPASSTPREIHSEKLGLVKGVENTQDNERTSVDELISTRDDGNPRLLDQIIPSQSQDMLNIDSKYADSTFSQSTIEEIYRIAETDDDYRSNDVEELRETSSLEADTSKIRESTSEAVLRVEAPDIIGCSNSVGVIDEIPRSEKKEGNSVEGVINEYKMTTDGENRGTIIIDSNLQPLISSQAMKRSNPVNLICRRIEGLDSTTIAINTRTEDAEMEIMPGDLKSQLSTEREFTKTESGEKITEENINAVKFLEDSRTDSAKNPESRNEGDLIIPDESFLEVSMESKLEQIVRQEPIEREKIYSAHVINNLKTNSTDSRSAPIDSTTPNTNSSNTENIIPSKNIRTENLETVNAPDLLSTSFLTDSQLDEIEERRDEMLLKNTSSRNPKTSNKLVQCSQDDVSLEFLPESELQRIEKEAYEKVGKKSTVNFTNINCNRENVFYRPEQSKMTTEKSNDELVMPDWVTSPAPEPNYDKIRRAVRMKREYIKNMLQEILRLSTIVSKVRSVIHAEDGEGDSKLVQRRTPQIQDSHSNHRTEINLHNRSVELGVSADAEININPHSRVVNKDLRGNDIFYVPQTSRPTNNATCNYSNSLNNRPVSSGAFPNAEIIDTNNLRKDSKNSDEFYVPQSIRPMNNANYNYSNNLNNRPLSSGAFSNTEIIDTNTLGKDSKKSDEFYVPQRNRSKHDAIPIFNRQSDAKFRDNLSSSKIESNAANIFSSLKHNSVATRDSEPDLSNNWYNARESGLAIRDRKTNSDAIWKNNEKVEKYVNTELRKNSLNARGFGTNEAVLNKNTAQPVNNDSIFYVPDKSSASNNYTLPCIKNDQIPPSQNFTKRLLTDRKSDEPRPLNFGKKSATHTNSNNDSIFYMGNK